MLKRKKIFVSLISLSIAAIMLTVTAFASISNVSGYEKLKKAAMKLATEQNLSFTGKMKLYEDGNESLVLNYESQIDGYNKTLSRISLDDNSAAIVSETSDGRNSVVYYELPDGTVAKQEFTMPVYHHAPESDEISPSMQRLGELMLDMLSGDVKNYFTLDGNRVSVTLQQNQVPEMIQLLLAIAAESRGKMDGGELSVSVHGAGYGMGRIGQELQSPIAAEKSQLVAMLQEKLENGLDKGVHDFFGKLEKNPVIKNVHFEGKLTDDGSIEGIQVSVTLAGSDENGVSHELMAYFDFAIYDVGTTKASSYDTSGKTVTELPPINGNTIFLIDENGAIQQVGE